MNSSSTSSSARAAQSEIAALLALRNKVATRRPAKSVPVTNEQGNISTTSSSPSPSSNQPHHQRVPHTSWPCPSQTPPQPQASISQSLQLHTNPNNTHTPAKQPLAGRGHHSGDDDPNTDGNRDQYLSTVQLLLEALAEQGKLRALLEYSNNPAALLQEISDLASSEVNSGLKIRSLKLELESIVVQVLPV
jgi:hypothetical protein